MREVANDPVLLSSWLFRHKSSQTSGGNALSLAARMGRDDVMLCLLDDMGVSATEKESSSYGPTPMEIAVNSNLLAVVQYLWAREDVRENTEAAVEALLTAARSDYPECLQVLITQPSPLNVNSVDPESGDRPLMVAAYFTNFSAADVLVANG